MGAKRNCTRCDVGTRAPPTAAPRRPTTTPSSSKARSAFFSSMCPAVSIAVVWPRWRRSGRAHVAHSCGRRVRMLVARRRCDQIEWASAQALLPGWTDALILSSSSPWISTRIFPLIVPKMPGRHAWEVPGTTWVHSGSFKGSLAFLVEFITSSTFCFDLKPWMLQTIRRCSTFRRCCIQTR